MKLDNNRSKVVIDQAELVQQAKKQKEYKKVGGHVKTIDGGRIW